MLISCRGRPLLLQAVRVCRSARSECAPAGATPPRPFLALTQTDPNAVRAIGPARASRHEATLLIVKGARGRGWRRPCLSRWRVGCRRDLGLGKERKPFLVVIRAEKRSALLGSFHDRGRQPRPFGGRGQRCWP